MSKSLKRVQAALDDTGAPSQIRETGLARTAVDAAASIGCAVDQIAKSIIFQGQETGSLFLFITAGSRQVDPQSAATLSGEALGKADASVIRARTGFAIGGVAPVGHLTPILAFFDPNLLVFEQIWAAAGTPHHVFGITPAQLAKISNSQVSDFSI